MTLSIDDMRFIKWYVAFHPDFNSDTGRIMMWGTGATQSGSTKQKLNTRSSTEAEVVGVDDMESNILWKQIY